MSRPSDLVEEEGGEQGRLDPGRRALALTHDLPSPSLALATRVTHQGVRLHLRGAGRVAGGHRGVVHDPGVRGVGGCRREELGRDGERLCACERVLAAFRRAIALGVRLAFPRSQGAVGGP